MTDQNKHHRALRVGAFALLAALLLTLIPISAVHTHADTDALTLPYTASVSFGSDRERWIELSCERLSIVVLSVKAVTEGVVPEISVYTDDGELIEHTLPKGDPSATLQFLPAYTGIYRVLVEYKGTVRRDAELSIDIREYSKHKQNEVEALPLSSEYTKKSHKTTEAEKIYGHCTDAAKGYTVSVFSIPCSAGGILSYGITAPEGEVNALLYVYDGGLYRAYPSQKTEEYDAGDAREVHYSEDAYLLVYSRGEFSLEADILARCEYTASAISLPYAGELDVSGGMLSYDGEAFDSLADRYPHSDIENPYVRLYEITASSPCTVSMLCEKSEHASFSLVSAERGLSAESEYPLRRFGYYCSETHPTGLCYESVLSDSDKLYLVYTGSAESVYVEIEATPTHKTETEYLSEYNKGEIIPRAVIGSVYSDSHIYERLGVAPFEVEMTKITGYMIESEDGTRYYYDASEDLTPPYKKGVCRLYAVLTSIGTDEDGGELSAEHRLLICRFSTTGVIIIPSIDEVIDSIKSGEPISILYIALMLIPIAAAGGVTLLILKRRKKRTKVEAEVPTEAPTEVRKPRPRRTPDIPTKPEEEATECSDCSNQEENVSSKQ